jgi:metal-responsive CopG/Arc/MetJ family transcriptional regulator
MSERYDTLIQLRAPADLVETIDKTADRNLVSRSAYVRTAVIERLRADGVNFQFAAKVA